MIYLSSQMIDLVNFYGISSLLNLYISVPPEGISIEEHYKITSKDLPNLVYADWFRKFPKIFIK